MSELKVSMVGLDTSHCAGIVQHLNDDTDPQRVPGARVVKAFPGGNPDFATSRDRIEGFTKELAEKQGLPMCDSLEEAAKDVDAIILTSVDGRQHREQFEVLAAAGKPVFIDKPFACSVDDAQAMAETSRHCGAPIMSSSMLRFCAGVKEKGEDAVTACEGFGPMSLLPDFPPYFWYGIHSVEILYTNMGTGCREVRAIHQPDMDLIVGQWEDGRIGSARGLRHEGEKPFGRVLFTNKSVSQSLANMSEPPAAVTLLQAMVGFFQTGESPIDFRETLEIVAFLEAAETSLAEGGRIVPLRK